MRISDWSSDVCSSDLVEGHFLEKIGGGGFCVFGFVLGKRIVGFHGDAFSVGRALRGLRRRRKTAGEPDLHPERLRRGRSEAEDGGQGFLVSRGMAALPPGEERAREDDG